MPSPIVELLAGIGDALGSIGLRWYVFGAQAAILHGATRLTADVDVTVDLAARPTSDLLRALGRTAVVLRVADAEAFVERTRVLPMVHEPSRIPVDVVLAGPGLEELFLERAEVRVVDGVQIPVASADDVVVMKILAGRPKDLDDVVAIVAAQAPALNLDRARATLLVLEKALDRRDLRSLLEQAVARAGHPR